MEHVLQEVVERLGVPTQTCVLAHITTQLAAMRAGAPVDLLFQSIAGTTGANASFGITLDVLAEGREGVLAHHATRPGEFIGTNVMYFETGQGSALSAGAHHGVDQLTLEARAYGVARAFEPFLVNTVVGFIGPEYLADERQITRAGLEDHFMGDCWASRWVVTSATRTTPTPTRTPPTTSSCCSPPRAATTSWACPSPTT